KIWASVLKNAIKRRKPDFNETYYGFRAFGNLLEEAQSRGLLEVGRDEKSGTFVYRSAAAAAAPAEVVTPRETGDEWAAMPAAAEFVEIEETAVAASVVEADMPSDEGADISPPAVSTEQAERAGKGKSETRRKDRGTRKPAAKKTKKAKTERVEAVEAAAGSPLPADAQHVAEPVAASESQAPLFEAEVPAPQAPAAKKRPSRKSAARSRRPRKTEATSDAE
ncbi:MAG TPA: NYN domain-containing protein, partial [Paraburkholderia sp.]|nr:NYN domain-containing protein [Paraburkholderia sp.]